MVRLIDVLEKFSNSMVNSTIHLVRSLEYMMNVRANFTILVSLVVCITVGRHSADAQLQYSDRSLKRSKLKHYKLLRTTMHGQ